MISKPGIEDIYPLTPLQEGMLYECLLNADSDVYWTQSWFDIQGNLDVSLFQQAWRGVVARHASLRTVFAYEKRERPLQVVLKDTDLLWNRLDWRSLSTPDREIQFNEFLRNDRAARYELSRGPLIRFGLIRLEPDQYRFVWSFHHLILDGWSLPVVLSEAFDAYAKLVCGEPVSERRSTSIRNYVEWLLSREWSEAERFFRAYLTGATAPTALVVGRPSLTASLSKDGPSCEQHTLSRTITSRLKAFARAEAITLNILLQAAWGLLLHRYSGELDVMFGVTLSGRSAPIENIESTVGLFINTLPLRLKVDVDQPVREWLQGVSELQGDLQQYQHTPLVKVQGWSEVPGGQRIFESLFVFENYPVSRDLGTGSSGIVFSNFNAIERVSYPLTICAFGDEQLAIRILYDKGRFAPDTVNRMLGHFQELLEGIIADPERRITELPILSEAERHQLLVEWNDTKRAYPKDKCVHELFEAQVKKTPDSVAVVFNGDRLTYRQLNRKANQVARYLRRRGVGPEVLVGFCAERSLELVIGLLGILKAGGAYIPLDPNYPEGRLEFMLRDSQVRNILTREKFLSKVGYQNVLCLDRDWEEIAHESEENSNSGVTAKNLAYVIYTSGSTGMPKGVEIEHSGLNNLITWHQSVYDITAADRATQLASPAFDACGWELWPYLTAGASIHIPTDDTVTSPPKLLDWLADERITISFLPTPLAEAILDEPMPTELVLRTLLTGGDKLRQLPQKALPFHLANNYGPTENTVVTTWCTVSMPMTDGNPPPIGKPIHNTKVYVLDPQLNPAPVGVSGELYIGGSGLARGYLNRPDLTQEKFIPDPFSYEAGSRLYKTGDLVRYRPDGNIEFLGRLDHQVKIRGFRIELEEIENVLARHQGVREAIVVVHKDATEEPIPVAYVVPIQDSGPTARELRSFLKSRLPEYMIPSGFVFLGQMPLTSNGKVDRKALAAANADAAIRNKQFVPPRDPVEQRIAEIYAQVLKRHNVGIHDNFFELGGHSLLATQVISQIRRVFALELPVRVLFERPTIEELAITIEEILTDEIASQTQD